MDISGAPRALSFENVAIMPRRLHIERKSVFLWFVIVVVSPTIIFVVASKKFSPSLSVVAHFSK